MKKQKEEVLAWMGFAVVVLLASGVFYYVWEGSVGRTVEGVTNLVQQQSLVQQFLSLPQVSEDDKNIMATNGCCNWLQRYDPIPSQLCTNVDKSNIPCYLDSRTQTELNRGYKLVDVDSKHCSFSDNCMNMGSLVTV